MKTRDPGRSGRGIVFLTTGLVALVAISGCVLDGLGGPSGVLSARGTSVCPDDVTVQVADGQVEVPIRIPGTISVLDAFGFDLEYDSTYLTYQSTTPEGVVGSFISFGANPLSGSVVRIGGFTNPPEMVMDDLIATVLFTIDPAATGSAILTTMNFTDNFAGMGNCEGVVTFIDDDTDTDSDSDSNSDSDSDSDGGGDSDGDSDSGGPAAARERAQTPIR